MGDRGFNFLSKGGRLNQKGVSLIEVMIAAALLTITAATSATIFQSYYKATSVAQTKATFAAIRSNILALYSNQESWDKSVEMAFATSGTIGLGCLGSNPRSCVDGSSQVQISLYSATGSIVSLGTTGNATQVQIDPNKPYVDSAPGKGFDIKGRPCDGFVMPPAAGNDTCPIRVNIDWRLSCRGGDASATPPFGLCHTMQSLLTATFIFNPSPDNSLINAVNVEQFNFTAVPRVVVDGTLSPQAYCNSLAPPGSYIFLPVVWTSINPNSNTIVTPAGCVLRSDL